MLIHASNMSANEGARVVLRADGVLAATYVLPIKVRDPLPDELIRYLDALSAMCEVIVVDGSDDERFSDFAARRPPLVRHVRPDPDLCGLLNGKVAGVLTGIRRASHERVVIADDDVRYDAIGLSAIVAMLTDAEIVRPHNYFAPVPWHARLDTARSLINRVTGGDWPGTLAVRRSVLQRTGGYDGNVMFENLELVRTVAAAGGREHLALGLYVRRLPPSARHFLSQRVRQAYDEFTRPVRMAVWLSILPGMGMTARRRRLVATALAASVSVVLAETGRRRAGGSAVFPGSCSLLAPIWVLERAVCAWLAVGARLVLGGIPYRGRVVREAASPMRELRRQHHRASHIESTD
jgi:hypothetical protein